MIASGIGFHFSSSGDTELSSLFFRQDWPKTNKVNFTIDRFPNHVRLNKHMHMHKLDVPHALPLDPHIYIQYYPAISFTQGLTLVTNPRKS